MKVKKKAIQKTVPFAEPVVMKKRVRFAEPLAIEYQYYDAEDISEDSEKELASTPDQACKKKKKKKKRRGRRMRVTITTEIRNYRLTPNL
jgi:TfoX/Sxy family transcriptional regulator of competence genes